MESLFCVTLGSQNSYLRSFCLKVINKLMLRLVDLESMRVTKAQTIVLDLEGESDNILLLLDPGIGNKGPHFHT